MVMASAGVNMAGPGGEGDNPAATSRECRLRSSRRRRFVPAAATSDDDPQDVVGSSAAGDQKRSRAAAPSSASSSSSDSEGLSDLEAELGPVADDAVVVAGAPQHQLLAEAAPLPPDAATVAAVWPVEFGSVALQGRMRDMEDTVSVRPSFCTWADGEPMHFFAVFDGHGGPHVSALCREQMHLILAAELAAAAGQYQQQKHQPGPPDAQECAWRSALSRAFARMDAVAAMVCACGRLSSPPCQCPLSEETALRRPWWPSWSATCWWWPTAATPAPCSAAPAAPSRSPPTRRCTVWS